MKNIGLQWVLTADKLCKRVVFSDDCENGVIFSGKTYREVQFEVHPRLPDWCTVSLPSVWKVKKKEVLA